MSSRSSLDLSCPLPLFFCFGFSSLIAFSTKLIGVLNLPFRSKDMEYLTHVISLSHPFVFGLFFLFVTAMPGDQVDLFPPFCVLSTLLLSRILVLALGVCR